jgi:ParB-like chromosome segregation protein Spo0J
MNQSIDNLTLREIACDAIRIINRHRRDMGDLEILAASIATEGLLQPIGITDENILVFGHRRLLAVRDILRQSTIVARVVHVSSILAGEYAENEIRKEFTPSERVAIGKALEAEIGNRSGQRTDLQPPPNWAEVTHGAETREIAAQKAGFESDQTYERAKQVVDQGVPELVEAMDSGDLSIYAASVIATQPSEQQAEIVKSPRELRREILRNLRESMNFPTPSKAREIAKATGMAVVDTTGKYRSGASVSEQAAIDADRNAIYDVTRGILAIANSELNPLELARRLEYWYCPDICSNTDAALNWLTEFRKGLKDNAKIQ